MGAAACNRTCTACSPKRREQPQQASPRWRAAPAAPSPLARSSSGSCTRRKRWTRHACSCGACGAAHGRSLRGDSRGAPQPRRSSLRKSVPAWRWCSVVLAESASALLTTHCLTAVLPYYRTTSLPHYSPLTTHHSLLTTHYSPLTTHHSLLTTHYSPLTTHYFRRRAHQLAVAHA
jgi:hypothetical protein